MDILKKIRLIFQNFSKTVINDLNKSCFQNYCASLIKVVMKKNNLNCNLAVSLKINIGRPNFS